MKLRIKGNSIRLRLLRSEVERFAADGRISEDVRFGSGRLRYSLVMSSEAGSVHAKFDNAEIAVIVPESKARDWANGNDVGVEVEQPIDNGETLSILVEKDFVCLDRPDDPDRADSFPNPRTIC